jgi:hypothetical protein
MLLRLSNGWHPRVRPFGRQRGCLRRNVRLAPDSSAISLYPRFRSTAGAERPLSDLEITKVNYRSGSAAPVRDHRMQTFGLEIVAIVGRRARTTAVAITDFRGGVRERQVPKWTGRSLVKPPPAPMGRQCQLATLGCSRSASKLSRWSIGMRERPLRPSTTLSPARAKGKFQGRAVVRWENRRRLLWVACGPSGFRLHRPEPAVRSRQIAAEIAYATTN